jgi:ribosomal protein S6--L-glutamate ligase
MIVSYHPIITADRNFLCAGRDPDAKDLAAIEQADAVILPQGCMEPLYRMARDHCRHVFPNLDARFDYPAKSGQARLLTDLGIAHPPTTYYPSVEALKRAVHRIALPAVIKFDWGGQGDTVFKISNARDLTTLVAKAAACERTGQQGLLVQPLISAEHGALRVVLIGARTIAYWRVPHRPNAFGASIAGGARIDTHYRPDLQAAAVEAVASVSKRTGLQLAGFDFIFDRCDLEKGRIRPLMLEINYFFGRTGLGGSQSFYRILEAEIDRWLATIGLSRAATCF